jgi:phage gp29-like protein
MALFRQLIDAARMRVDGAAQRFVSNTLQTREIERRARNRDPDPYWMQLQREVELSKRPPSEQYEDFPISAWQDWSIATIRGAVQAHVSGVFGQAAILVESMLADDRIQSATNGRVKGVTKCMPAFEPQGSKRAAKELEKLWPDILPEETLDQLLTWAIFLGFALAEIVWESKNDRWVPRLKVWHPLYVYYRLDSRRYVALTTDGPIEIEEGDPKWFLFVPWGSYRGWIRGAVRSCSIPWVVRQFALRDWGRFSEVHGLPIKKAKVPSQAPAEDKARFLASLARLGAESLFLLPQQAKQDGTPGIGFDVDLLEAKDRAWEAFPGLIAQCERSMNLAIRGTNLTTEVDGGSFAAAAVHRDEDSDLSISDRRKLASAIKRQILEPFCLFNYGKKEVAPNLTLVSPETDQEAEATVLGSVVPAIVALEDKRWPIDRKLTAEKYGIVLRSDIEANRPVEELEQQEEAAAAGRQVLIEGAEQGDAPEGEDDVGRPGEESAAGVAAE